MSTYFSHGLRGLAAAALIVVAACGGDDAPSGDTPRATGGEPRRGGTLVYLDTGEGDNLDPAVVGGILSAQGAYPLAVYDVLLYEQSGTGEIVPRLAESLEPDGDTGDIWTLTLRSELEFSDGTPFDAEAVRINWERIADPEYQSPSTAAAQSIESLEVVDDRTLRIELAEPNGQFPRLVAQQLPFIGSPTAIEAHGEAFGVDPIGAGPFILDSWTPGSEVRFVRNPTYWDAPKPYLDELILRTVIDDDQRYNTIASGAAHVIAVESGYSLLGRAAADRLEIAEAPGSGGFVLPLNVGAPPFDDPVARRALAVAIDRQGLIDTVLDGGLQPFETLFNADSPFFDASAEWPSYDPAEAQQLIDSFVAETGGPLTFNLLLATGIEPYGEYLQTQLAEYENLQMNVEYLAPGAFFERLGTGSFDAGISVPAYADPEPVIFNTLSTGGSRNFGGYSNVAMDDALQRGRQSRDLEDRREAYRQVQALAIEDMPHIWLAQYGYHQIHKTEVHGLDWAGAGVTLWSEIWLDD